MTRRPAPPPAALRPRGPLPARVYWTRRLVLLGLALVLVAGLARLLGSSSDGAADDGERASVAGATTSTTPEVPAAGESTPARQPGKRRHKRRTKPPAPVLAEPTGPCESSDIVVTPVVEVAEGGRDVPITLNLRTRETPACTWTVSPETLTVSITSGSDAIWSTRECPAAIPAQDVVVRQAVDAPVVLTWPEARRSDEDCSRATEWAGLGWYHVEAAALGGEPTDVQFELVRPASAVITRTVTPKPETKAGTNPEKKAGKKAGKKKRPGQQDTAQVPGEDGAGNSVG